MKENLLNYQPKLYGSFITGHDLIIQLHFFGIVLQIGSLFIIKFLTVS